MVKTELNAKSISAMKLAVMAGISLLLMSSNAFAADELGDGICKVVNILTGKWLFGFTILATLGAGAGLLFGGEMTDGIKKLATIITIVGLILGMVTILTTVFTKFGGLTC